MTALRVLIVAENASTRFGGEAILPYHYFRLLLARGVDTHLIVHARTREELLEAFAKDLAKIHFVEDQLLQKLFFLLAKLLPRRVSESTFGLANQLLTQRAQRRLIRGLVTVACVIHQPIPVSPRFPSLLYDLGPPVIIGPLNGGMEYPPAFRDAESGLSRGLITLGRSLTDLANAALPGKRRAAVVLVANARTRDALPSHLRGRILELPENAVDTKQWRAPLSINHDSKKFVFIGRLVEWKALDLAIEALRSVPEATLDIIGDGPMVAPWRGLAERMGVAPRIQFHGWLTQTECAAMLCDCCALILPSLYESGGAVVLEAMAMARPVIATEWGGPCDYLDARCGILVAPTSRAALVQGFAKAMQMLLDSPTTRERMGAAGKEKLLREFDWDKKIDRMLEIYGSARGWNNGLGRERRDVS